MIGQDYTYIPSPHSITKHITDSSASHADSGLGSGMSSRCSSVSVGYIKKHSVKQTQSLESIADLNASHVVDQGIILLLKCCCYSCFFLSSTQNQVTRTVHCMINRQPAKLIRLSYLQTLLIFFFCFRVV